MNTSEMSKFAHPSTSLKLVSMVFCSSTLLTLYLVTIQEGLQQQQYNIINSYTDIESLHKQSVEKDKILIMQNDTVIQQVHHVGRQTHSVDSLPNKQEGISLNNDFALPPNLLPYSLLRTKFEDVWMYNGRDRIVDQLQLASSMGKNKRERRIKTIVLKSTFDDILSGQFAFSNCPVSECILTRTVDQDEMVNADAIMFGHIVSAPYPYQLRPPKQVWIYFNLESSSNTKLRIADNFTSTINWTATYRRDSTIVTPYEKFVVFPNVTSLPGNPLINYAAGKRFKVAWFVSNCGDGNGRKTYAKQLSDHISVHVYGACSQRKCPRRTQDYCFQKLRNDYKFYLAFENSNCKDYISEKFFRNALMHDVIPIVMGAPRSDYEQVAPPQSFIHIDDFTSPKHLAAYLHILDRDDSLYNEYFRWKTTGTFINTHFFCRLCAMLHAAAHDSTHVIWQEDIQTWWNKDQCIQPNIWASWTHPHKMV